MRTDANEANSAADSSIEARLLPYIPYLRLSVTIVTLMAAVSMGFSKQTDQSIAFNSLTGITTYISISAKATDSSSFLYFIIANAIVFVYSAVLTALSFIKKYGTRTQLQLPIAIADLVVMIILFTANAAAAVTEEVAWNGNSHYGWNKFCNLTKTFCGIVITTNVISSLAAAIYFLMIVFSIVIIHRRSQY